MATWQTYRTARTSKRCDDYPRCPWGIQPGERYLRATVSPHDIEVNQSDHWWTLNLCYRHMTPERAPKEPPILRFAGIEDM